MDGVDAREECIDLLQKTQSEKRGEKKNQLMGGALVSDKKYVGSVNIRWVRGGAGKRIANTVKSTKRHASEKGQQDKSLTFCSSMSSSASAILII